MLHHQANPLPVIVIVGPTASGKSDLALDIARRCNGEIISADSRQIYRELNIGTAKPSPEILAEIRHHFINERELGSSFTAGAFTRQARERITAIHQRSHLPVVAGGSTLYIEALLDGLAALPPSDPAIRGALLAELEEKGAAVLYRRLRELDPEQAGTMDPSKTHRLVRSLEIITISGTTVSRLQAEGREQNDNPVTFHTFGLQMPRERLYERINQRTGQMVANGLEDEARQLFLRHRTEIDNKKVSALQSVGYQEFFASFRGLCTIDEAISKIRQHTRNYAKRQMTFFKNRLSIPWVEAPETPEERQALVNTICSTIQSSFVGK